PACKAPSRFHLQQVKPTQWDGVLRAAANHKHALGWIDTDREEKMPDCTRGRIDWRKKHGRSSFDQIAVWPK
ncbi:MAG: hypothetical protein L0H29_10590, partial [Sinobacteraceae bacterium]|nr:hypothetical protein [Nevskiaceae bacterium]